MQTKNIKVICYSVIVMLASIAFTSCQQKGCTNRDAINYNVTADKDDGSCIFCTPQVSNLSSNSAYLIDDNFSSSFYNQQVALFSLTQPQTTYPVSECGSGSCTVNLVITNLVNKDMFIDFEVRSSGPVSVFYESNIDVPANSSLNVGVIETLTSPPFIPINEDLITVETFNNIVYH